MQISTALKFLSVLILLVGLTGCHQLVQVHYTELLHAGSYEAQPNNTRNPGPGFYAAYCITRIENNDTNATSFTFMPSKIGVTGRTTEIAAIPQTAATSTIPAGRTMTTVGTIVLAVHGDVPEAALAGPADLTYHTSTSPAESVLMVRDNPRGLVPVVTTLTPTTIPTCQ